MYFKVGVVWFLMLFSCAAQAKMLRVAVVDSGYNGKRANICKWGSYDFTLDEYGVGRDNIPHGTNVSNTIAAGNSNYCLIILKVFNSRHMQVSYVPQAIEKAIAEGADVINLSLSGQGYNKEEHVAIVHAISLGIKVFAASGNDSENLDLMCDVYPACYRIPGLEVVGTYEQNKVGNDGSMLTIHEAWCAEGMCGTSLSTAIATQKYLKGKK